VCAYVCVCDKKKRERKKREATIWNCLAPNTHFSSDDQSPRLVWILCGKNQWRGLKIVWVFQHWLSVWSRPSSHKRDQQPVFKFYMEQDATWIYRMILMTHFSHVVCVWDVYIKHQNSDWLECSKEGYSSTNTQNPWFYWIDRKHTFYHAKFEGRLTLLFTSKSIPKKSGTFHGIIRPFSNCRSFNPSNQHSFSNLPRPLVLLTGGC
jgi:hypothetical protein